MPWGFDLIPGVNVGNAVNQLFDQSKDYDIFDDYTVSGRDGQSGPNLKSAVTQPTSTLQNISNPSGNDSPDSAVSDIYGTSGTGGYSLANMASDRAYLDDQQARLERQRQSADIAERQGLDSLSDSYNKEVTGVNSQRSRALEDFNTKREDTSRGKGNALERVDRNARTLGDSLRRRIGMASGSSSSAYQLAAPNAVAREASQDRSGVMENYGMNLRNLATAEDRAKQDFESLLGDLESQRKSRESDFRSGLLDRRNQIDTSLSEIARQRALLDGGGYDKVKTAMQPYASAIDARQSEIDSLFDRFRTPFNVKPVEVQNPDLRKYTVDGSVINEQTAASDPFAQALRRRQTEEDNRLF